MKMPNPVKYNSEDLKNALDAVERGIPISTASRQFGVPRTTLLYKKRGIYPKFCRKGPRTNLTDEEEMVLVRWMMTLADRGFPIMKIQLIDSVELIFKHNQRPNNFTNGRPGKKWYDSFLKRHPEVAQRVSQNLHSGRTAVNETKIRSWFKEVRDYITENKYDAILEDPRRTFNADESAFFLSPKAGKVLARKGDKTVYSFAGNSDKECLTTLFNVNADGMLAPPMVVYKYARIPPIISKKMPDNWAIGKSENGWMTSQTFFEYVSNIFYPWLIEKKIELPVFFFVNGHSSHLTLPLSEFCSKNGIILIALPPNATHIIQPLDVAVFRTLKGSWKNEVTSWRLLNSGVKLNKDDFSTVLRKAVDKAVTPEIVRNGFRTTGLHPFDENAIKYNKYFKAAPSLNDRNEATDFTKDPLTYFESFIDGDVLNSFRYVNNWTGELQHKSLYDVWRKIRTANTTKQVEQGSVEMEINNDSQVVIQNNDEDDVTETAIHSNTLLTDVQQSEIEDTISVQLDNEGNTTTNLEKQRQNETSPVLDPSTSETNIKNNVPEGIPTPFKTCLLWPQNNSTPKQRRTKVRLPSVATSVQWKQYHVKQQEVKANKEAEKEKRKQQRQQKQLQSKSQKQKKRKLPESDDSSSEPDDETEMVLESEDDENNSQDIQKLSFSDLLIGDNVIVRYEDEYFPGIILELKHDKIHVSAMSKSGFNTWKWPSKKDQFWYELDDIIEKIESPSESNSRGAYKVPEIVKYNCFTFNV